MTSLSKMATVATAPPNSQDPQKYLNSRIPSISKKVKHLKTKKGLKKQKKIYKTFNKSMSDLMQIQIAKT